METPVSDAQTPDSDVTLQGAATETPVSAPQGVAMSDGELDAVSGGGININPQLAGFDMGSLPSGPLVANPLNTSLLPNGIGTLLQNTGKP